MNKYNFGGQFEDRREESKDNFYKQVKKQKAEQLEKEKEINKININVDTTEFKDFIDGAINEIKKSLEKLNFSEALEILKSGERVKRNGWNGKDQFIVVKKFAQPLSQGVKTELGKQNQEIDISLYFQIFNNGKYSMWVPSTNDIFAEDWEIVL